MFWLHFKWCPKRSTFSCLLKVVTVLADLVDNESFFYQFSSKPLNMHYRLYSNFVLSMYILTFYYNINVRIHSEYPSLITGVLIKSAYWVATGLFSMHLHFELYLAFFNQLIHYVFHNVIHTDVYVKCEFIWTHVCLAGSNIFKFWYVKMICKSWENLCHYLFYSSSCHLCMTSFCGT